MSLGLFDVIGPVIQGPSSSHRAGANRIGYLAGQIMGGQPDALEFGFHPDSFERFLAQRFHVALTAGCLGWREDDAKSVNALEEACRRNIEIETYPLDPEFSCPNMMRVHALSGGINWEIDGISLGGGHILISGINGVEVSMDGNYWGALYIFETQEAMGEGGRLLSRAAGKELKSSCCGQTYSGSYLYCGTFLSQPRLTLPPELKSQLKLFRIIPPLVKFRQKKEESAKLDRFEYFLTKEAAAIDEEAIHYECRRTASSKEEVLAEARRIVEINKAALKRSLEYTSQQKEDTWGKEGGRLLYTYAKSGNTLTGETFNLALARAVLLAEAGDSLGLVVAAPISCAAGILPAVLLTAAEQQHKSNEDLARAFLVAAAVGAVIGSKASFSEAAGGCQSEIGIGAAMAAAAAAWLGGADNEGTVHGAALALQNMLGLICDLPSGEEKAHCIKRNAMGAAIALMAAEMALSGIRSAIAPDLTVDALADTQRLLLTETGSFRDRVSAVDDAILRKKWINKLKA